MSTYDSANFILRELTDSFNALFSHELVSLLYSLRKEEFNYSKNEADDELKEPEKYVVKGGMTAIEDYIYRRADIPFRISYESLLKEDGLFTIDAGNVDGEQYLFLKRLGFSIKEDEECFVKEYVFSCYSPPLDITGVLNTVKKIEYTVYIYASVFSLASWSYFEESKRAAGNKAWQILNVELSKPYADGQMREIVAFHERVWKSFNPSIHYHGNLGKDMSIYISGKSTELPRITFHLVFVNSHISERDAVIPVTRTSVRMFGNIEMNFKQSVFQKSGGDMAFDPFYEFYYEK